jgi:hypothetical protein
MLLSLLEPAGRAPTLHAWLAHDAPPAVFGHGIGNGYAMDCAPPGAGSCTFARADHDGEPNNSSGSDAFGATAAAAAAASAGGGGGAAAGAAAAVAAAAAAAAADPAVAPLVDYDVGAFYCYNPSAFFSALASHLRMNNDSAFLQSNALQPPATGSALTVDEVLEAIAVDFHGCALLLLRGWVGRWVGGWRRSLAAAGR